MNSQVALILSTVVVSWVMFVFNFVLGYYIGRAVESGDQLRKEKKAQELKKSSK